MNIQLSDHFTYKKLLRFTLPSIGMMIFTSIYGVVDGLFVSNFVGKTPFAAVNLIMPFAMILGAFGAVIAAVVVMLGYGSVLGTMQEFMGNIKLMNTSDIANIIINNINNMDFFSKNNFEREHGFVSKIETSGFEYPNMDSTFVNNNKGLNAFYVDKYDMEVPLCSPIMEGYYKEVLDFNGDVILTSNYNPEMPVIISNSISKVNLNGKKVIAPVFTEKNGGVFKGVTDSYAFWVKEGGDLTIEGDGEVIASEAEYSMAVWSNGGKVTIKGGKFYNNGNNSDLIYDLCEKYEINDYANNYKLKILQVRYNIA